MNMLIFNAFSLMLVLANLGIEKNTNESHPVIYLIPGQGADERLFNELDIAEPYKVKHINYKTPKEGTNLKQYAQELSNQIDTTQPFILIGVSLGGMLATEMSDFLSPEKVIIISSAKHKNELPFRYRFQQKLPLYKAFSSNMVKKGALIAQPIVEPDRNKEKATFVKMLKDKDPEFLKRTIDMIINWDRTEAPKNIIHIHGTKDKTIPIRNVAVDFKVDEGSHMMTLTRGKEISILINQILKNS